MKILEVIDRVDRLNPNNYTIDEKLRWCDEVGAVITQEINKKYSSVTCKIGSGGAILPPDIDFEQIQYGFMGNRKFTKADLRSVFIRHEVYDVLPSHSPCDSSIEEEILKDDITLVYLEKYQPIRYIEIYGEFETNGNRILIDMPPFEVGDMLMWTDVETPSVSYSDSSLREGAYGDEVSYPEENCIAVIGVDELGIDTDIEFDGNAHKMYLKRIITDETLASIPYDDMYIEYILSKIAYYQQDYNEYSVHSGMYNTLLDGYAKWYKQRNPLDNNVKFNNFWEV